MMRKIAFEDVIIDKKKYIFNIIVQCICYIAKYRILNHTCYTVIEGSRQNFYVTEQCWNLEVFVPTDKTSEALWL